MITTIIGIAGTAITIVIAARRQRPEGWVKIDDPTRGDSGWVVLRWLM
jgi:hypothetical protein